MLVVLPQTPGSVDADAEQALLRQAAEQERRRLGRDLHDSVSAALFALHVGAAAGHDLPVALEALAATTHSRDGLGVELRLGPALPAVPLETVGHLVRIAAEAVHDCRKHAGADAVRVELEVRGSELVLAVTDQGRGFDLSAVPADRHGQRTVRERAVLCGGRPARRDGPDSWHPRRGPVPLPG